MTPSCRRFKDAIYEQFSRIGKAIACSKRLELLDLLAQGERTVEVLAREANLSFANASQHLQVLRNARLVSATKKGVYVTYALANSTVMNFFLTLQNLAETQLAEVEQTVSRFFEGREDMEPVDKATLIRRVQSGEVAILDVRPPEEYRAGHIPEALCIPLEELERRLSELPTDREIVAYCRGPYCVLAVKAVEILRAKGYRAVRLEDGIPEWRAMGRPVATGGSAN